MRLRLFWIVLLFIPTLGYATWQVTNPAPNQENKAVTANPQIGKTDYPHSYQNNKKYLLYLRKGLLFENVKKYAAKHGWKVRWLASHHYPVLTNTTIAGDGFEIVMKRLFANYPLYIYYNSKIKVMTVSQVKIIQKTTPRYSK